MGYQIGNSSCRQVACTGAYGKHGYQQDVESFSYPFTMVAHHIIAGRHEKRVRVIIVGLFNELNCYRLPKHMDSSYNISVVPSKDVAPHVSF